jgi:acyl-CoA thioesterase-1
MMRAALSDMKLAGVLLAALFVAPAFGAPIFGAPVFSAQAFGTRPSSIAAPGHTPVIPPAAATACPPGGGDAQDPAPLPHLATALKTGGTLSVLAVGSATVFGPQASAAAELSPSHPTVPLAPSQTGFPWQMAHALEAAIHGLHVNVTVIGGHGLSAAAMLTKMRAELARHTYRLVIWQTGTVEAVNMVPTEDFYQTLVDGAGAVAAAGADLVLVDPQFSRFLEANANLAPYGDAMQAAGALPGVILFHRFDLMREWTDSGSIDLERTAIGDRLALATRLHACLGQALAHTLLADIAAASE